MSVIFRETRLLSLCNADGFHARCQPHGHRQPNVMPYKLRASTTVPSRHNGPSKAARFPFIGLHRISLHEQHPTPRNRHPVPTNTFAPPRQRPPRPAVPLFATSHTLSIGKGRAPGTGDKTDTLLIGRGTVVRLCVAGDSVNTCRRPTLHQPSAQTQRRASVPGSISINDDPHPIRDRFYTGPCSVRNVRRRPSCCAETRGALRERVELQDPPTRVRGYGGGVGRWGR